MHIIGLFLALTIGVVLGLVGGGGSILTVPLVHYFFGESMLLATTYSLFVVSIASGLGMIPRVKQKQIDFKQGILFVIPSMLVAFSIRKWVLPGLPPSIPFFNSVFSTEDIIALLLIIVMLYTALKTFVKSRPPSSEPTPFFVVVLFGILTGVLSGIIGAGGGFIIVPILLRLGAEMRKAVGTSLFIITIQSVVALLGDFSNGIAEAAHGINWMLLLGITGLTVSGVFLGTYIQRYFSGKGLRKMFSIVLIIVSVGIAIEKLVH